MTIEVPYPPATVEQALAWVEWAEAEIGVGWHPDTGSKDLVTSDGSGPLSAECSVCGGHFVPNDESDLVHIMRDSGFECGGEAKPESVGRWGLPVPLFTGERAKRYDDGLAAAHQLLPDIYATSMLILKRLHPEVVGP